MSPTSLPSPLSICPSHRESRSTPAVGAIEGPIYAGEVGGGTTAAYSTGSLPIDIVIGRRMSVLAEFMISRPANVSLVKVIAVDGLDRQAVHGMIANLQHRIRRDLQYAVRVINEDYFYLPADQTTELSQFIRNVHSWRAMWETILHAPPVSSDPRSHNGRIQPAAMHPDHPTMSVECPLIYILPLSPLMATTQAMHRMVDTNDPWRVLSAYWKESFRPDVTINIEDIGTTYRNEVLRLQVRGMEALVVMKEGNTGLNVSPKQMRRVVFEAEELIRW